jgi:hypothetical protein
LARRKPLQTTAKPEKRHAPDAAIWIGLLVLIMAVYWQVRGFDFVS